MAHGIHPGLYQTFAKIILERHPFRCSQCNFGCLSSRCNFRCQQMPVPMPHQYQNSLGNMVNDQHAQMPRQHMYQNSHGNMVNNVSMNSDPRHQQICMEQQHIGDQADTDSFSSHTQQMIDDYRKEERFSNAFLQNQISRYIIYLIIFILIL